MRTLVRFGASVAFVMALASCTADPASHSPRAFAERFIAAETRAWSTGSLEDLQALERDDVVFHLPGMDLAGWKAHADYILNARPMLTDLKQEWTYLAGEGRVFALNYRSTAIMASPDGGAPAKLSVNYLCVVRLAEGQVAEVWMNGASAAAP